MSKNKAYSSCLDSDMYPSLEIGNLEIGADLNCTCTIMSIGHHFYKSEGKTNQCVLSSVDWVKVKEAPFNTH